MKKCKYCRGMLNEDSYYIANACCERTIKCTKCNKIKEYWGYGYYHTYNYRILKVPSEYEPESIFKKIIKIIKTKFKRKRKNINYDDFEF